MLMGLAVENVFWKFYIEKQMASLDSNFFSGTSEAQRQLKLHGTHSARREKNLQGEIISNLLTHA